MLTRMRSATLSTQSLLLKCRSKEDTMEKLFISCPMRARTAEPVSYTHLIHLTFQLDACVVDARDMLDDGKAQTGTAGSLAAALIHTIEALKHAGLCFFRDADAAVSYTHLDVSKRQVLALVNDLMVVFGTFVLLRTALDGNFIAAMLTILGYSINDTVVVYDRIRENRTLMGKKASFEELVNHSVNQSARRTLITTITTVMALGVMCIVAKLYGLDSIFTFAFPLMMGMNSGVYTSLCVSTSAWVLWSERKPKTKA